MANQNSEVSADRWLICEIATQHFAISVKNVVELIPLSNISIHCVPRSPQHVEGVVDLRGIPLAVADLRSVLDLRSMRAETDDILEMLSKREAEHVQWIEALEHSVASGTQFQLATDPHRCKFGQWYDEITNDKATMDRFTNGDLALLEVIERFDTPHQRIHNIARKVMMHAAQGDTAEAKRVIEFTRDTDLVQMVELFGRARDLIVKLRKGVIVVLEIGEEKLGALVDSASEVRTFAAEDCQTANLVTGGTSLVTSLVQDPKSDRLVQLLDVQSIYNRCQPNEIEQLQPEFELACAAVE